MSTPLESVSTIYLAHGLGAAEPTHLLDQQWTRPQLLAVAEADSNVQKHPQHMLARIAVANHGNSLHLERIRASVARTMGGTGGTHYIVAALHLAYLALAFPQTLSATQRSLLLAPLEAAESAGRATEGALADGEIAA